ncbi:MAG: hypothetical protein U0T83_07600 [Bacteriovoracaceae bacterium]
MLQVIALLMGGLYITQIHFLAYALNIHVNFLYLNSVIAIAWFIALIPFSLAGFGIKEASYMYLLKSVGIESVQAASLSMLDTTSGMLMIICIIYPITTFFLKYKSISD